MNWKPTDNALANFVFRGEDSTLRMEACAELTRLIEKSVAGEIALADFRNALENMAIALTVKTNHG